MRTGSISLALLLPLATSFGSLCAARASAQNLDVEVHSYGAPSGVPMGTPTAPGIADQLLICAFARPNQQLEFEVSAPGVSGQVTGLLIGLAPLNLPVYPGTLLVDPLATYGATFDASGEAHFSLPLPNLPGLTFYVQAVAIDFAQPWNLFAFSRGLTVEIVPHQPTSTAFDQNTAQMLMELAWDSYEYDSSTYPTICPPDTAHQHPIYAGRMLTDDFQVVKEIVTPNPAGNPFFARLFWPETYLFVAKNSSGDVAIVFRGTDFDSVADWTTDLLANQTQGFHIGFLLAYSSVVTELTNTLTRIVNPDTKVYLTGHSLGGALAPIAGWDLAATLTALGVARNDIVLYSFAGPRAMTPARAAEFGVRVPNHFNVVNKEDPVSHLPPVLMPFPFIGIYEHIPRLQVLYPRRAMVAEAGVSYLPAGPALLPVQINKHCPWEYASRLAGILPPPQVSLSVSGTGDMTLNWSFPERAAWGFGADFVALYRGAPNPNNPRTYLLNQWQWASSNGSYVTGTPKGRDFYVAYVQQHTGDLEQKILAVAGPYTWPTPTVSLSRSGLWTQLNWNIASPGRYDYVALYNRDPRTAGPLGYLLGQWQWATAGRSWVSSRLWSSGLWVAYIEDDALIGSGQVVAVWGPSR